MTRGSSRSLKVRSFETPIRVNEPVSSLSFALVI